MPAVVVETQGRLDAVFSGIECVSCNGISPIVLVDLFDLSQHVATDSSLKMALEQNMHATQRLVTSFLKSRPGVGQDATYHRCQMAQTEVRATFPSVVLCPLRGIVYGTAFRGRGDAQTVGRGGGGSGAVPGATLDGRDAD